MKYCLCLFIIIAYQPEQTGTAQQKASLAKRITLVHTMALWIFVRTVCFSTQELRMNSYDVMTVYVTKAPAKKQMV